MIRQAFRQVGPGLPIDGSQDYDIKIKDFPEVQVGNWNDWQPTKEGDIEEFVGLRTPELI